MNTAANNENGKKNKLLLLDIGDVLLNDGLTLEWWRRLAAPTSHSGEELEALYRSDYHDAVMSGRMAPETLWAELGEWLGEGATPAAWPQARLDWMSPRPAAALVDTWAETVEIGILSNHVRSWVDPWLNESGIADHADIILVSDETGFRKPRPEAFEVVLQNWSDASSILYVDDKSKNIEAASLAGISGVIADPDDKWIEQVNAWVAE